MSEQWLDDYLELFNEKPDMNEIEWRHEMVPIIIHKQLNYPSRNVRFEKDYSDIKILDDSGIQHIVIETKSSERKLGKKTLKQAFTYLQGGESYVVLASQFLWRVFRPGKCVETAKHLGDIRFTEEGIENESLFRQLGRDFMLDNERFAEFRSGDADNAYISIDERGFPKLVNVLQLSVEMLHQYAQVVWPRQQELYDEYTEKFDHVRKTVESVKRNGEAVYQQDEKLRLLEQAERKLAQEYATPIEAVKSYEVFKRIQPYSGSADEKALLDIFLREAAHLALNRALLIRILEDKKLLKPKISNGGIGLWRKFTTFLEKRYQALLRFSFWDTENLYHHFFAESAFDWYLKVDGELGDVIERVLFLLNSFDFSDVDRDMLSRVYQNFFSPDKRKKLGEFYTPNEVILYLLKKSGFPGEGKLLDFSCGSGGFLVEALKQLLEQAEKRGISAEQQWRLAGNIVGFDINPFAVHIAEMNLLSLMVNLFRGAVEEKKARGESPRLPDLNVFCIDSLLQGLSDYHSGDMGFETWPGERYGDALESRDLTKYRYLVGNPPYVRNERLESATKQSYAKLYDDIRQGNTDIYAMFMRRAFDWLEDGGRLAVIVSQGLAESRSSEKIRRFIEQYKIEEIVPLEWAGVFMANINPFLIIIKKEEPEQDHQIHIRQGLRKIEELNKECGHSTYVSQKDWANLAPDGSWRLEITDVDLPIVKKLNNYPKPFKGEYGMVLRSKEILIRKDKSEMKNPRKVLDGREVSAWLTSWQGRYIDYDLKKISDPKSYEFFNNTQVVLRRISLTTQATAFDPEFLFRDTLMSVSNTSGYSSHVVCAIINSMLNRYFTALINRSHALSGSMRSTHTPRVINNFLSPLSLKDNKDIESLDKLSRKCHALANEMTNGDIELCDKIAGIIGKSPRHFSDLHDSDFSSLWGEFDLSKIRFTRDGSLTDGTLFQLRGNPDALYYIVHHAQLKGKRKLKRAEVERYPLPPTHEQLIEVNKLIHAWLKRKPTLGDQLRAAEAKIDELIFVASDLTQDEVETVKRRCTEFPLSELLKTPLPGKLTRQIESRIYKNRYK